MTSTPASPPRFCSECGTEFLPNARFCHSCGAPVGGPASDRAESSRPPALSSAIRWGLPAVAVVAVIVLSVVRSASSNPAAGGSGTPLSEGAVRPPDISAMSPEERADRLFNHVMRLWSEGKADSAAFFAPMALTSYEALSPLNAHQRYDMGLVALVSGDTTRARAQSDSILAERPTHLLGLVLAARTADARGDSSASRKARERLLAAEKAERSKPLQEYIDHDADLRAAIEQARSR